MPVSMYHVSEHWTLEDLCQHFVHEMKRCTMLAWGTGASANWQIKISYELVSLGAFEISLVALM
jgi:hypothetical protein